MNRLITMLIALLLPIAGVLGMIIKSELTLARGLELRVPIRGFDPRDLLRGQYLTFQYDWTVEGQCAVGDEGCCYCFNREAQRVTVEKFECGSSSLECIGQANAAQVDELRRFYIPEGVGTQLEELIRKKRAVVVLAVTPEGRVALKDLEIDGRPWREALTR